MVLQVKEGQQIDSMEWDVVWPYDEAVDLDASDLLMWVRSCGEDGITLHDGRTPTRFTLRTLDDPEITQAELGMSMLNGEYEASRYGIVKIVDGPKIRLERRGGLQGLADEFLKHDLGGFSGDLPWALAQRGWYEAKGIAVADEPDESIAEIALPRIFGAFVLARTFRAA